jgi:hypothetical protein
MNETIPNIFFDSNGICSYCHINDKMEKEYPLDGKQSDRLKIIVDKIKEDSKDKKYDCVIGVSGGCDSSLILCKMKEFGLRALAVTFDNTWSTDISTNNISNMPMLLMVKNLTIYQDHFYTLQFQMLMSLMILLLLNFIIK